MKIEKLKKDLATKTAELNTKKAEIRSFTESEDKTIDEVKAGMAEIKEKEDEIDRRVGIILCKKIGDQVKEGEVLAYLHANDSANVEKQVEKLKAAYKIVSEVVNQEKIVDEIL